MRGKVFFIFGIIVSIVLTIWILFTVDYIEIYKVFQNIRWRWLILMTIIYLIGFIFRGLRWQLMLRPITSISWSMSSSIIIIGYMANNFLPLRLGEFVRAFLISKKKDISVASSLSSIIIERVFDGLVLLGIFIITTSLSSFRAEYAKIFVMVGNWASGIFFGCLILILIARLWPLIVQGFIKKLIVPLPISMGDRIQSLSRSALDGVKFLRMDWSLPAFLFLSILIWISEGGMFWFGLVAFNLEPDLIFTYFTLALVNLLLVVPSAPAYVGVFQGATILAFSAFNLTSELALSYSLMVHIVQFSSVFFIGLFFINLYGISTRRLIGLRKEIQS